MIEEELSKQVILAFFRAFNGTGSRFLENMYQRCLEIELRYLGLAVEREVPISLLYRGEPVGEYRLDVVVERRIIVECKACDRLLPIHEQQLVNYLAATGIEVGLLFNFGAQPTLKRLVYEQSKTTRPRHLSTIWKRAP
jgi:GxxExxY protein